MTMVTGAVRDTPHGVFAVDRYRGLAIGPCPRRSVSGEIETFSAVIDAVHQPHPCQKTEKEADDGSSLVHHRHNLDVVVGVLCFA